MGPTQPRLTKREREEGEKRKTDLHERSRGARRLKAGRAPQTQLRLFASRK